MIRILCPHCHASLSTYELEQAEINGQHCLLCPDCASVLVSERADAESHPLEQHCPEPADAHA